MARTRRAELYDTVQKVELEKAGPLLFGRMWQTQMAELMQENAQYLRRCLLATPEARLMPHHRQLIRKALEKRIKDAQAVIALFDRHDAALAWAA
jgi:hypothetical protein